MNNNNNKRNKNRPGGNVGGGGGGGGGGGNSTTTSRYNTDNNRMPKQRVPLAQGVYTNTRFMHSATSLVGAVVDIHLRSGNIYEGVFRTFSPNFDVVLELPVCTKSTSADEPKDIHETYMIFPFPTIVSITAKDFDPHYAAAGKFQTDAAISEKFNGSRGDEIELEPWDASGMNGDIDIELDGGENGWDATDMFRQNEHVFGVQSNFDDSLSTYTVQLTRTDSDDFKKAEAKAEKLAAEIENNPACRDRLDLENGDEEALFAAVERPSEAAERERERERERDREREREREREKEQRDREERDKELKREWERERDQREREKELEREPHYEPYQQTAPPSQASQQQHQGPHQSHPTHQQHAKHRDDRNERGGDRKQRGGYEPRDSMTERYITKPTRSITGGPQLVGMGGSSQQGGGQAGGRGSHMHDRHDMKGSASQSGSQDGGKYGGPMMKRKPTPQGNNKMVRNTPPPNSGAGGGGNTAGSGPNNAKGGNSGYPPLNASMQQGGGSGGGGQSAYYSQVLHEPSQYHNQSHMSSSGPSKINGGDSSASGGAKPLPQRTMRQYSGMQSNSSLSYGENQMTRGGHGGQSGNTTSPPLQSGGGHGPNAGASSGAAQPQRHGRTRDSQLQDLRQFGQDFQLAGGQNTSPPGQQPQGPPPQPHQGQQAQQPPQQQQQPPQMHVTMIKGHGGHQGQPQPSVSPPHQQPPPHQQQAPPPQHGQQQQQPPLMSQPPPAVNTQQPPPTQPPAPVAQVVAVATQPHLAGMAHVPQQPPPPATHVPIHMYVPPPQVVQHQLQKPPQGVEAGNVIHVTAVPPHHVAVPPPAVAAQVVLAQDPNPPMQTIYQHIPVAVPPQTSPVALAAAPVLIDNGQGAPPAPHTQPPPPQAQPQQATSPPQQQQQQQAPQQPGAANKGEPSTPTASNEAPQSGSGAAADSAASSTPGPAANNGDKGTPPPSSASGSATATAAAPKKTYVLNPSAKPFTPRSPSTPNASRPHTPQTPVPISNIYTAGTQLAAYAVMPTQQTAPFQGPSHPPGGQPPRMRRNNYAPMGSQMHVSPTTATGQPLMAAAAPMQQFLHYGPAPTPHGPHFQGQAYPSMVRMYEPPPQQIQFLSQTPPSTTPSPGQPHQQYHQQPQPSPAGGGPQQAFGPQAPPPTYHMMCSVLPHQLLPYPSYPGAPQHPPQTQYQILMQSSHPTQ